MLPTVAAAVLGNAFVGRESLTWFADLRRPRMQVPMPAFYAVGAAYYGVMGTVLHRADARGDREAYRLGLVVLAGNELWNAAFFGRRSTATGFLGLLVFGVPVVALQRREADDRTSALVLAPYTAWVLGYDIPWTYRLWRLNGKTPADDGPAPSAE